MYFIGDNSLSEPITEEKSVWKTLQMPIPGTHTGRLNALVITTALAFVSNDLHDVKPYTTLPKPIVYLCPVSSPG